tara:strand:- start:3 stop:161 length:159 start_codon:yes stop_codon:yes gene_type:complete
MIDEAAIIPSKALKVDLKIVPLSTEIKMHQDNKNMANPAAIENNKPVGAIPP